MKAIWLVGMILCGLAVLPSATAGQEQDETERLRRELQELTATVSELRERVRELEALVVRLGGSVEAARRPATPGTIHDSYDRFTGARRVRIDSQPLCAAHKDDPSYTMQLYAHWIARQEEGQSPHYVLLLRHRRKQQQWTGGADLIMLVGDARHRTKVTGRLDHDQTGAYEYIEMEIRQSLLDAFTSAAKVEVRVGDWECEIPGPFRSLIADHVRKSRVPTSER